MPIHRHSILLLCIGLMLLAACVPTAPPRNPAQPVEIGAVLIAEQFEVRSGWDTYNLQDVFVGYIEGGYQLRSQLAGQFVWGTNGEIHEDALIEANLRFDGGSDKAIAGVMCRVSPQNNGRGYYFLIAADGAFSIRYGTETSVEPLLQWQSTDAVRTNGRENLIRAVCNGNYLALFVNGTYLGSVDDSRYNRGYTGLVVGLPPSASADDFVSVVVGDVYAWEAD